MHSWNMGYDTETNYNFGYFSFLNPYQIRFNLIARGISFPEIGPDFNACELGFGNGVSIVMHAANSPVNWYGNDFNPSQVSFAQLLAQMSHTKVHLSDDAFDQFLERDDLPMFDYICLHGIFSWISQENRAIIVKFIQRYLKIGGVLFISYNVGAGFGKVEPFRYLLQSYINNCGDPALSHVANIPAALKFIDQLLELNPGHVQNAPWLIKNYQARIVNQERNYVAHEFLNGHWFLDSNSVISELFERAKLNFVGQACLSDDLDELNLSSQEQEFLAQYQGSALYNSVYEYVTSQIFRRDLFVKGLRQLTFEQKLEQFDNTYFISVQSTKTQNLQFSTRLGNVPIDNKRIASLVKFMSDYQVHSFKEIRTASSFKKVPLKQLMEDVIYAQATGVILVAANPNDIQQKHLDAAQEFNLALFNDKLGVNLPILSSPILGGALVVEDMHKFLISIVLKKPHASETDLVCYIDTFLQETGNTFKIQDRIITDHDERLNHLSYMVHDFMSFKLPLIRKLCCL